MTTSNLQPTAARVGLIGYGEVGKIFAAALRERGASWVGAWDLKFTQPATQAAEHAHARGAGVVACDSAAALCRQADLIISAVTASSTLAVAEDAARAIRPGSYFLDLNSASPATKTEAARAIDARGARYVEAGVMTSVPPYGIAVPMLLGGAHAAELAPVLGALGMKAEVVAERIGVASAIKLCRSVMIKGLEAIVIESFTTARHYGVEAPVLASLHETFPSIDWERQGDYFFSRVVAHGKRRAEEMREAAVTVRDAALEPTMAGAIAERQDSIARMRAAGVFDDLVRDAGWRAAADLILANGAGPPR